MPCPIKGRGLLPPAHCARVRRLPPALTAARATPHLLRRRSVVVARAPPRGRPAAVRRAPSLLSFSPSRARARRRLRRAPVPPPYARRAPSARPRRRRTPTMLRAGGSCAGPTPYTVGHARPHRPAAQPPSPGPVRPSPWRCGLV